MPNDILILLVGENPLPNWVVARYLLNNDRQDKDELPVPSKIILLHSHQTQPMAQNLKSSLENLLKDQITLVGVGEEERDAQRITEALNKILNEILKKEKNISSLHLNYTGGTKPMSVHSYLEITAFSIKGKKIFSDLNPTTFKIQIAEQSCNIQYPTQGDLRDKVSLGLKEIFELHGMELKDEGTDKPTEATEEQIFYVFSNNDDFKAIEARKNNLGKKIDFGKLFEDYILLSLKETNKNIVIEKNVKIKYKEREAEMDVVVLKGYQLFLFSCTVSTKLKEVKHKAFEALYRAEQLGGVHAHPVVVTLLPMVDNNRGSENRCDLESLKKDLSSFNIQGKYDLLGISDINDRNKLQNKLREIMK